MAELAAEFPDRYFVHINGFRAGVLGNAPCWRARLGKPETVCRGMVIYY
jgi:hypothetical protein